MSCFSIFFFFFEFLPTYKSTSQTSTIRNQIRFIQMRFYWITLEKKWVNMAVRLCAEFIKSISFYVNCMKKKKIKIYVTMKIHGVLVRLISGENCVWYWYIHYRMGGGKKMTESHQGSKVQYMSIALKYLAENCDYRKNSWKHFRIDWIAYG